MDYDYAVQRYVSSIVKRVTTSTSLASGLCFTCGEKPTTGQGEHVIPAWLQKRFDLHNQRLTLVNNTLIPYRSLTVPCCESCNNGFLRGIKNAVIDLLSKSTSDETTSRLTLAQWLCKILIGTIVKETTLPLDRSDRKLGNIVPSDFLKNFYHAHLILQSARKTTEFHALHGPYPFTLYKYPIHQDDRFGDFDISTHVGGQSIAIRIGKVGPIFVNDGGLQLVAGQKGPFELDGKDLHPVRFSEIASRVHYKAALRDATHAYTTLETPEKLILDQYAVLPYTSILVDGDAQRIFLPWDEIACAKSIEQYRSSDLGPAYDISTGMSKTTLRNEKGELPTPSKIVVTPAPRVAT